MNPPKMPIHIGDFLRDTGHLRAAGTGAYLMLLFHHWSTGSLPDDDDQLAAIARMTAAEWRKARPTIEKFFEPGWRHGRVEEDLEKAKQAYQKRAKAGEKGGKAKAGLKQSSSNATAPPEQPLTFNLDKKDAAAPPSNAEKELYDRGKQVLGERAGGLIKNLVKAKNGDVALARAAIETASTKSNPREYIGGIVNAKPREGEFVWKSGIPGVI